MKGFENIVVLIPAFMPGNELNTLVLAIMKEHFYKIVVVDDGSGEAFSEVFDALPNTVIVLKHLENKGKGRALKTGLAYIYAKFQDCLGIVTCDADGQHTPGDVCKVAKFFAEDSTQSLILGSRTFQGEVPRRSALGNRVTRDFFHLATGIKLRDTQTGLRAFPYRMIPRLLSIPGEHYEYEMNMLLELAKEKIDITEVEMQTVYINENRSSHFRTIRDSAIIFGNIIRFSFSSLICFGIDFTMLFVFQLLTNGLPYGVSLLISVICARAVSSIVNFLLNRHVVFQTGSRYAAAKYYALALCIMALNYTLLYCFSSLLTVPLFWSKLIAEILLFMLSYVVQKKWIFTKECPA